MERKEFIKAVRDAVADYIAADEAFDDNACLQVDTETLRVELIDGEDAEESDIDALDFYPAMDLITMDANGHWLIDEEAVESIADEYSF